MFFYRFSFAGSLSENFSQRVGQPRCFQNEQSYAAKEIFGIFTPKLVVVVFSRIKRLTDGINVAQPFGRAAADVIQRVVAMCFFVVGIRRKQIDFLSARFSEA